MRIYVRKGLTIRTNENANIEEYTLSLTVLFQMWLNSRVHLVYLECNNTIKGKTNKQKQTALNVKICADA